MKQRTHYQEMSNHIQAALDTQNRAELDVLDKRIADALALGHINLPEAGELTVDLEMALSELSRDDNDLDEVYAAVRLDGGV
jgi:dihydroneopterin aldolase